MLWFSERFLESFFGLFLDKVLGGIYEVFNFKIELVKLYEVC